MRPGEAMVMQSWLRKQASRNGFYYNIQVDSDSTICSIFWPDSIMRADYALFGDFISFDTTYRTNKSYKHCMKRKKPVTFMTHQAPAIAVGVRQILTGVFHALSSWHIKQNAIKKLGASATSEFLDQFKHLVKHVDDEDQFEYTWSLIQEFFFANRRMFQDLVDDLRHKELMYDLIMQNTVLENRHPNSRLICHAAELFTPTMFEFIQKEFDACKAYSIKHQRLLDLHLSDCIVQQTPSTHLGS
ncbi:hypothetical protein LIER_41346 [Lithospermum erythrorhizon]|uniref:Protein FAR1-RELATED SEQUENCE n=1 Tax=Lithospermum erythrorhizon TaxID=34254 RepID=A0AAV3R860_LITER